MIANQIAKKSASLVLAGMMLSMSVPLAFAQTQQNTQYYQQTQQSQTDTYGTPSSTYGSTSTYSSTSTQQRTYTIPAGTSLTIRTVGNAPTAVGSEYMGQIVNPVTVNGVTVIPAGSQVRGSVVGVNSNNTVDVQLEEVSASNGQAIPISSRMTVNTLEARVQQTGGSNFYPSISWGRRQTSPGGKVVAGTLGGAAFGAATGALTGVIIPSVYRDDMNFNEGTGALRGAIWGTAVGAGLGLVSGLVAAASDRNATNVTTTTSTQVANPRTNIVTGSLEEIPVAYSTGGTVSATQQYTIILDQPITVSL